MTCRSEETLHNVPMPEQRKEVWLPWWERWLAWLVSRLVMLWCGTLRFEADREEAARIAGYPQAVFLTWHNSIFVIPSLYRRYRSCGRMAVLVSASRDGAWLEEVLRGFRVAVARGSSSRRGAEGLRRLVEAQKNGFDIGITPDGPRGPRYQMGRGATLISEMAPLPVVLLAVETKSAWRLRSWDRFRIPVPFSRVRVTTRLVTAEENARYAREERATFWRREMLKLLVPDDLEEPERP